MIETPKVGVRRLSDHTRWHVATDKVSASVPQSECPLCLAEPRPRKKGRAKHSANGDAPYFDKHAFELHGAQKMRHARRLPSKPFDDAKYGVSINRPAYVEDDDWQSMHFVKEPIPRKHKRVAPFKTRMELIAWLKEKFPCLSARHPERNARICTAARWFIVGEKYFLLEWSVRDILSKNLDTFRTKKQIQQIVNRMCAKFPKTGISDGSA